MWNLRNKTDKQDRKRLTDTENKLRITRGEKDGGIGKKGEAG